MKTLLGMLLVVMLVGGCASSPPAILRDAPVDGPTLSEVESRVDAYIGRRVLWGGTIAGVENAAASSSLEIVERPLHARGRPLDTDRSEGRFIARVGGFVDPAIYAPGREVTVVGKVEGVQSRAVGEHSLDMPLIDAQRTQLWPRRRVEPYVEPYYYDPFWPHYRPYPYWYPYPYRYYWH